jgi:hypothetical protein
MHRNTLAALLEVLGIGLAALSIQVAVLPEELALTPAGSSHSAGGFEIRGEEDDHEADLEWLPRPPSRFDTLEELPRLPRIRRTHRLFIFEEP